MTFDGDDDDPLDDVGIEDDPAVARRRSITVAAKRLTKIELQIGALLWPERNFWRPHLRGECSNVARPCPYVSCRYHLYLDVSPIGSIKYNHPGLEPWQIEQSCSLDIAEWGGVTLEYVGSLLNITRERVRQVELHALQKLAEIDLGDIDMDDLRAEYFLRAPGHVYGRSNYIYGVDASGGDDRDDGDAEDET